MNIAKLSKLNKQNIFGNYVNCTETIVVMVSITNGLQCTYIWI